MVFPLVFDRIPGVNTDENLSGIHDVNLLKDEIQKRGEKIISLNETVRSLEEQLAWFKRQIFGKRSERVVRNLNDAQLMFEGFENVETPKEEKKTVAAHTRRKPNRNGQDKITLSPDMPVQTTIIDLPEEEKVCQETGESLVQIGVEVTHKLAHKPGSYYIKEFIRPKYVHPEKEEAEIQVLKYVGYSRKLLSQWVIRCGVALKPLHDEMLKRILESRNIFIDETPVKMQDTGKCKQTYLWTVVGGKDADPPYRIYEFKTNRCHDNVLDILKNYRGGLHSDKYAAYQRLAEKKVITWYPCWSHIRRKFFEAESGDKALRDWVLRKIRYLFMFERIAWSRSSEERLRIRREKEGPIIDELIKKIKDRLIDGSILPKSKLREAMGYFCGLIPYLKNYLSDRFARMDNNVAERAIRPLTIGRKNWLFFGSEDGGEAGAILFSLVQTCRGLGINPREYLEDVMRRMMDHPRQKLFELLPDEWQKARQQISSKS